MFYNTKVTTLYLLFQDIYSAYSCLVTRCADPGIAIHRSILHILLSGNIGNTLGQFNNTVLVHAVVYRQEIDALAV